MIEKIRIDDLSVLRASPSEATRPPVLFVHGYFADAQIWAEWLQFFADRGVPAFAVDLRGRHDSRPTPTLGRVSIEDFVADAAEAARAIGARTVIGHSMGGLIAQKLAERGDVDAAVLITPAPPRGISVITPRVFVLQLKYMPAILLSRVVYPGREDLRELVLNRVPVHDQEMLLARMLPDSGRAGRDMSVTGVPVDAARVRARMLVVAAEDDAFIPLRIVTRVAERYRAPLYVAEHHGHMVIVEPNWQEVASHVEAWVREHGT